MMHEPDALSYVHRSHCVFALQDWQHWVYSFLTETLSTSTPATPTTELLSTMSASHPRHAWNHNGSIGSQGGGKSPSTVNCHWPP
eukprot:scaffold3394_cov385-Prasinococcus_capsulatus_cf.AAC.12